MPVVGQAVNVRGEPGVVRYVGPTEFAEGVWVGVELNNAAGRNNGTVQGKEYFQCSKEGNFGIFVREALIEKPAELSKADEYKRKILFLEAKAAERRKTIESLELALENLTIDTELLRTRNFSLSETLSQLESSYSNLQTEFTILKEEQEINGEIDKALIEQDPSEASADDYKQLVAKNRELDLTVRSLEDMVERNKMTLLNDISNLQGQLREYGALRKKNAELEEKLHTAEDTIATLQQKLEDANLLHDIVETLTQENESLNSKVAELEATVQELNELHELDRSLEESQMSIESELKAKIEKLQSRLVESESTIKSQEAQIEQLRKQALPVYDAPSTRFDSLHQQIRRLEFENCELSYNLSILLRKLVSRNHFTQSPKWGLLYELEDAIAHLETLTEHLTKQESNKANVVLIARLLWVLAHIKYVKLLFEWNHSDEYLQLQLRSETFSSILEAVNKVSMSIARGDFHTDLTCFESIADVVESLNSGAPIHAKAAALLLATRKLLCICTAIARIPSDAASTARACAKSVVAKCSYLEHLDLRDCDTELELPKSLFETFWRLLDKPEETGYEEAMFEEIAQSLEQTQKMLPESLRYETSDAVNIFSLGEIALKPDNEEKDKEIQDLSLHVQLLETNMATSGAEHKANIKQLEEALLASQNEARKNKELNERLRKEAEEANKQTTSLLRDYSENADNQILAFEDPKARREWTVEMALREEVGLLRRMLDSRQQFEDILWLERDLFVPIRRQPNDLHIQAARQRRLIKQALRQLKGKLISHT